MPSPSREPEIVPPPAALQLETLCLVLADSGLPAAPQAARLLEAAQVGQISLAGLRAAMRGQDLVGAAWGLAQAGRTALVWPPRLAAGESETTRGLLLRELLAYLSSANVCLVQTALPPAGPREFPGDGETLLAHGFWQAAELLYLVCHLEKLSRGESCREHVPPEIEFDPFSSTDEARLIGLIERTYEGTRDCPQLNGLRDTQDVLDGYRSTGEFAPERWLIAHERGQDVGCLLLADHPLENQWELVYMGVAPKARGRGLGLAFARLAVCLAAQAGRERIVLAVDADNGPALANYEAAGFVEFDRRRVFLKALPEKDARN